MGIFFNSPAERRCALTRAVCHQPNCQLKFYSSLWIVRDEVRINGRDFVFPIATANSPKGNYLGANTALERYRWHYVPSAKPWPWDKGSSERETLDLCVQRLQNALWAWPGILLVVTQQCPLI